MIGKAARAVVRVSATVYLWVAFWGAHALALIGQVVILLLFGWWVPARLRDDWLLRCQQFTVLVLVTFNPHWWYNVARKPAKGVPRGSIIVCNHLSYVDSWLVAAALFPKLARFVAMGKLFKMPVFGQVMKLAGHIKVDFYRKDDGRWAVRNSDEIMDRSKAILNKNRNIAVFPEGTLSYKRDLLPFKDGFFRLAFDERRLIVPMACWGNHRMFPPGDQFNLASFARVQIAIGDAVDPTQFASFEELRDHVREEVRRLRDDLPNFDNDIDPPDPEAPEAPEAASTPAATGAVAPAPEGEPEAALPKHSSSATKSGSLVSRIASWKLDDMGDGAPMDWEVEYVGSGGAPTNLGPEEPPTL